MKKTIAASLSVLGLALVAGSAVQAASITDLVPAAELNAFCANKPANAHVAAQFTQADGTVVTGTIECEKANVAGASGTLTSVMDDNGAGNNGMGMGSAEGNEGNEGNADDNGSMGMGSNDDGAGAGMIMESGEGNEHGGAFEMNEGGRDHDNDND